ncbi:MAG: sulfatase-like hydrolase/transferase [Pirellulales bacterium]
MRYACLLLTLIVAFSALGNPAQAADKKQPNILFIFADDQCYETIGAFGHTEIQTPNLDTLVRDGLTFTRTYNQGSWSGAVCVASRTMLNTGRFIWHANSVYQDTKTEREEGRFWSEIMKKAGYDTYFTGKWHVRADATKAFDYASHVRGGMPKQTKEGYNRPHEGKPDVWSPYDRKFGGFWEGGKHWSEVVGDDAVGFLKDAAKRENPFFMYIAFNAPHDPRQSPKEFVDMYPLDKISMPVNFRSTYPHNALIGCSPKLRDENLAPYPRTEYSVKVNRQEYYAIITHMDVQIGRILETLKSTDQAKDTYIFFSADHGLAVGHHGLMGKQNMHEHSVRVPMMVVGPNVPKGESNTTQVYLQDIMATTLDLAGVDKPSHVDFNSLMPLVRGEKVVPYDAIYGGYLTVQRAVTFGDYKMILYPKVPEVLLYNLKNDPHEMHNLYSQAKHKKTAKKLFAKFLELQTQMGDELDLKTPFPELQ